MFKCLIRIQISLSTELEFMKFSYHSDLYKIWIIKKYHSVKMWKVEKFTLTEKYLVKSTIYLVILVIKTLFSRNFYQKSEYECGKTRNPLSPKFFREINVLVTSLLNALLSRIFWQKSVSVNFRNFQGVHTLEFLREINFF